ncbi:FtsX-like permease family protein [Actinoplanes sp. NPDC051851]|uniref:FtsX-like permease family protein n=1 Tax=Actinoplanes sp. NPDC051851 TaxID=3154753 RepID=UPI00343BC8AC
MRRVLAELGLGVRLALSGGRRGWGRTAMAATGVAIGAAALLLGASVPVMLDARQARTAARLDDYTEDAPAGRTVVTAWVESQWGENAVRGRLIWPDTADSPLPPGLPAFPGEHQMYASPALQAALAGPDGADLRRQMPYDIVGTIAPAGLSGPHEFAYYAGYHRVVDLIDHGSWRVARYGVVSEDDPSPRTYVIVVSILATVLLPVAIFIGAALRFGAEARDRRLAAIRLIGADRRAVLRVAVGESLVPAGVGMSAGVLLYLIARVLADRFWLFDVSVYPSDVRPVPALAALVVLAVFGLAVVMNLLGFRGVTVEPLGVLRSAATWHGRLWWRLIPLAMALLLLFPAFSGTPDLNEDRTGLGVVLLVVAVVPLLPYLVPLVARLFPGAAVSWQLAAEQLRRNPAGSTRAVTGIVVAVAGVIALQSFFAADAARREAPDDAADPAFILQAPGKQTADQMRRRTAMFEQVDGITAGTVAMYPLTEVGGIFGYVAVGDCVALRQIARVDSCADGDAFTSGDPGPSVEVEGWEVAVPENARTARPVGSDAQNVNTALLLTPAAAPDGLADVEPWFVETRMFTTETPASVVGTVRGVAAEIDPLALFTSLAPEGDKYSGLRTALNVGSVLVLAMMALGLLLDVGARLHERRRLLGVLSAVGARRTTVVWSVLWQAIVPVASGLALAVAVGTGLGVLLMRTERVPVAFRAATILEPALVGGLLVLGTTVAVLLPAVRRVTRTGELRHE